MNSSRCCQIEDASGERRRGCFGTEGDDKWDDPGTACAWVTSCGEWGRSGELEWEGGADVMCLFCPSVMMRANVVDYYFLCLRL